MDNLFYELQMLKSTTSQGSVILRLYAHINKHLQPFEKTF
jgi:hypothetical protein